MPSMTAEGKSRGRVLLVGLCCIDVVNFVERFPAEDSDTRVFDHTITLGGNAANSTTVLRQLDPNCELFASLPRHHLLLESLIQTCGINVDRCVRRDADVEGRSVDVPMSTIIVNRKNNASRTILHYRGNLPELSAEEFIREFGGVIAMEGISWVHFEGRNFDQVHKMMQFLRSKRSSKHSSGSDGKGPRVSVELEKLRPFPYWMDLAPLADVVFVSKEFALDKGWTSMTEAIDGVQREFAAHQATVICPWGEKGACGRASISGPFVTAEVYQPEGGLVDTLAAGDCFIGAALHYLNRGNPLEVVLKEACRVAGSKCGQKGLLNLGI